MVRIPAGISHGFAVKILVKHLRRTH